MYIIPVTPWTLNLIASLNGEVRVKMEEEPLWFVFRPNGPNTIINRGQFQALGDDLKNVTIFVR